MSRKSNIDSPPSTQYRVLFVASPKVQNIGGLERQALSLASFLKEDGSFFAMACAEGGGLEQACRAKGLPTLKFHPANSFDLLGALSLARILIKNKIDIVHVHSRRDYLPVIFAIAFAVRLSHDKKYRPRLVFHAHLVRELAAPGKLSEWLYTSYLDRTVAVSKATRNRILQDHIIPDDRVRLLYNGVDFSSFYTPGSPQALEARISFRQLWGVPQDAVVIGMVGRLCDKGQLHFVRAIPALREKIPNLRVVMVGPEGKDGYADKINFLADNLEVKDVLYLPGPAASNVPQLLNAFDALVHLPIDEAFGLALVEAGAAQLPVIATLAGGCTEVVTEGVNGLLVSREDQGEVVHAVLSLFDPKTGSALRKKLGEQGREMAVERFGAQRQHNELLELYKELCQ
jgi:glycosyltransferase involved in cell wall biosynthesis